MNDPGDFAESLKAGASALGGGALVAAFMSWLKHRDERKERDEFVELRTVVMTLTTRIDNLEAGAEKVWDAVTKARAGHRRMDALEPAVEKLEHDVVDLKVAIAGMKR